MFAQIRNAIVAANAWFDRMMPARAVAIQAQQRRSIGRLLGRFGGRS
jgi:hypothetical protein